MSDYPPPSYACITWFNGTNLCVRFPAQPGSDKGHVVEFATDPIGLAGFLAVLRERAKAQRSTIGTYGAPVQYDIRGIAEALARTEVKPRKVDRPKAIGLEALRSLLEDEDLL